MVDKKYFVQVKYDDGEVSSQVLTATEILSIISMSDCSGDEVEVYDGSVFGKLTKLVYELSTCAPYNHHAFVNPETYEIEFEGFTYEH